MLDREGKRGILRDSGNPILEEYKEDLLNRPILIAQSEQLQWQALQIRGWDCELGRLLGQAHVENAAEIIRSAFSQSLKLIREEYLPWPE